MKLYFALSQNYLPGNHL